MTRSTTIFHDIALMALTAEKEHWTEAATLEAALSYAWAQLQYRRNGEELVALVAELSEDLSDDEEPTEFRLKAGEQAW